MEIPIFGCISGMLEEVTDIFVRMDRTERIGQKFRRFCHPFFSIDSDNKLLTALEMTFLGTR